MENEMKALPSVGELRALLAKATPGEWVPSLASDSLALTKIYNDAGTTIAVSITAQNAAFVAEMKRALPSLLDEVERARAATALGLSAEMERASVVMSLIADFISELDDTPKNGRLIAALLERLSGILPEFTDAALGGSHE